MTAVLLLLPPLSPLIAKAVTLLSVFSQIILDMTLILTKHRELVIDLLPEAAYKLLPVCLSAEICRSLS